MADPAGTTLADALRAQGIGDVRVGVPLSTVTTLKVGGAAAALVRAESTEDLSAVARVCADLDVPWLVVGRGSNLLVADDGWRGVAIVLGRGLRGVQVTGAHVLAGAAEPMPVLATTVADQGLAGFAFAVAIPGTLGGAVRMNAGAHGGQMSQVLEWADVVRLAAGGATERIGADDLVMRYRHTALPDDAVVVAARLRLRPDAPEVVADEMAEMRRWRRATQPINQPSCGSVFRNPDGDSAGRLIEAAGLKGHRIGGAEISTKHANFITVSSGASAADVHGLVVLARAAVARASGTLLVPEVVMAGFDERGAADLPGGEEASP